MKKQTKNKEQHTTAHVESVVKPKIDASTRYVVIRDGYRVSDREYMSDNDSDAVHEKEFWAKVARFHSCGEAVDIVVYDARKHRVW